MIISQTPKCKLESCSSTFCYQKGIRKWLASLWTAQLSVSVISHRHYNKNWLVVGFFCFSFRFIFHTVAIYNLLKANSNQSKSEITKENLMTSFWSSKSSKASPSSLSWQWGRFTELYTTSFIHLLIQGPFITVLPHRSRRKPALFP